MPIPMELPADHARERFLIAPCNAQAIAMIDAPDWPAGKLIVTGPAGSGKTHLLHIWAAQHQAVLLDGKTLATRDLTELAASGAVALDDAAQVAGDAQAETALFHLHNMLAEARGRLLLAARTPVRDWGIALPDLLSRLQAAPHVAVAPPDDALLAGVLGKLFADRQVIVADNLIPFLLPRMERSLAAAQRIVAALDAEALARKAPITRQLAADVMQKSLDFG
ncbi:MAG: chromosomal replication initiator DnaA [Rhodobacteraceae bacterium]|nr:MAG: chromosomal replication initiator DnaA [Paracoccaceae bacterium]